MATLHLRDRFRNRQYLYPLEGVSLQFRRLQIQTENAVHGIAERFNIVASGVAEAEPGGYAQGDQTRIWSERQRSVLHHGRRYQTLRPASAPMPFMDGRFHTQGYRPALQYLSPTETQCTVITACAFLRTLLFSQSGGFFACGKALRDECSYKKRQRPGGRCRFWLWMRVITR